MLLNYINNTKDQGRNRIEKKTKKQQNKNKIWDKFLKD
jgi:hypothetical protein